MKILILALAASLILPVTSVKASDNAEPTEEIAEEIAIVGGVRTSIMENISYLVPGKTNDYLDTAEVTTLGPQGHRGFLISIKELADKTKDTDYKFDLKKEGDSYKVTKGQNYTGDPYIRIRDTGVNADLAKEREGKIIVDGKTHDVWFYKIDGNDFIYYSSLMEILYNKPAEHLEKITKAKLDDEIKKSAYTIIASFDANVINGPYGVAEEIESLYNYSKANKNHKLGLIGIADYGDLYTKDEIKLAFTGQNIAFPLYYFGEDSNIGLDITGTTIVDSKKKKIGKTFEEYKEEYFKLWLKVNKLSQKDFDDKYEWDEARKIKNDIADIVAQNFLDYALGNKKVELVNKEKPANKPKTKEELITQREALQKSLDENRIKIESANFLLTYTPKTVANVKDKLNELIKKSEDLQKRANKALADIDKGLASM